MNISEFLKSFISGLKGAVVSAKNKTVTVADLVMNAMLNPAIKFKNVYRFECFDSFGNLKWVEEVPNTVMTAGINDLLTNYFKGSAYTAAFFVGLVDNASFSAYATADTMASHAGWLESAAYSNATRPALTLGTASAGSIDNSASKAVFNINATATILGAFVTTNSTKSGTTGVLYGAASFTGGSRSVLSGDTLNITCTLSAS
jgi:hypothetical protein